MCVAKFPKDHTAISNVVTIPLQLGECREERADDLRQWCAENCRGEWRPLERWTDEFVRIAFECAGDAVKFRLSV
jgi:hypothetical protein